jgi:hypothetical protein
MVDGVVVVVEAVELGPVFAGLLDADLQRVRAPLARVFDVRETTVLRGMYW